MAAPDWVDTPSAERINTNLSEAYEAFDLAYFKADSVADLDRAVTRCINALRRVQSAARREAQR